MIVGIDLGTTFSSIAYVNKKGVPVLCPDARETDRFYTSSVVHLGSRGCLVGDLLEQLLEDEPDLEVARFVKQSMGDSVAFYRDHEGKDYSPEVISAFILKKLKNDAELACNEPVTGAVITVPAHFNDKQREATRNAGRLAELDVLAIVEEPVAAGVYFGIDNGDTEKTMFVIDMGGGTLDATIVQQGKHELHVLATEGEKNIGGRNFDEVIMDLVLAQYETRHNSDMRSQLEAMQRLRRFATGIKIELTAKEIAYKPIQLAGNVLRFTLNRQQFEEATAHWMDAARDVCERSLAHIHLQWQDVDEVALTGGSSLMPSVMAMARDMTGLPPDKIRCREPRYAVAYGAAILAEQKYGGQQTVAPSLKQTVTSNELGIKVFDKKEGRAVFHSLIEKNIPVPVSVQRTVYTRSSEQRHVSIEVLQRKDPFSDVETLGKTRFGPLSGYEANHPISITMGYDETGRVTVHAADELSGHQVEKEYDQGADGELSGMMKQMNQWKIIA
jgi:molecular chaperone DnaK